jgi:VanZ family protein
VKQVKALALSFLSYVIVLFAIIVIVTFARKDFDFQLSLMISAVYMGGLIVYFAILSAVLSRRRSAVVFLRYWVPVFAYVGVIFYLSSIPNMGFATRLSEMDPRKFSLHVLEYMGLGFLLCSALSNSGLTRNKALLLTLMVALAFGYADEKYQLSIPGRRFNPYDVVSDELGAMIGAVIAGVRKR